METPRLELPAQVLSPSSSGRRSISDSNSPEFEFWMLRNPSFPQPNLLSADELFVDGVLLPLHLLPTPNPDDPPGSNPHPPNPDTSSEGPNPVPESEPASGPELSSATPESTLTASKRWKDIFKKPDRKNPNPSGTINEDKDKEKEKGKKKERKSGGGGNGASSAELNINIWPFSRSRSAGNRPRTVSGSGPTRKVSSAPCSRSNSAGESKSRKWPGSPSRGGVHLSRSSPVWQIRRGGSGHRTPESLLRNTEKAPKKEGNEGRRNKATAGSGSGGGGGGGPKARVLSLNVPMCIGYRSHMSCRSDESSAGLEVAAAGADTSAGGGGQSVGGVAGEGGRPGNLFNLRSLFTSKKVY